MPLPDSRLAIWLRFGAAGFANTATGLGVTLAAELGAGMHPASANALGYAVGVIQGFILSRHFVFRARGPLHRYVVAIGAAFLLNQGALASMHGLSASGSIGAVLAQCIAMSVYTVCQFLLSRHWVFAGVQGSAANEAVHPKRL